MDFYNPYNGLYPIDGLTREELALATLNYLDLIASCDGDMTWGEGDSLDRERVRDILIETRAINQDFDVRSLITPTSFFLFTGDF